MSKPIPLYRTLLLSGEVDNETVKPIITAIMDINRDDDLKEEDYRDWERTPILLFLNTNGGSCYDAWALVDIIKASKTPVHTIALGWCMSAGLLIFTAGHKRLTSANATLMYHDVFGGSRGKTELIRQELDECKRLSQKYCDAITEISLIKQEQLDDYINRKAEWYIPAEEAVKLKLADGYYK